MYRFCRWHRMQIAARRAVLAGAASLTKQGEGLVRLTGANTYSGRTQVLQ